MSNEQQALLPDGAFEGRLAFADALRKGLAAAAIEGWQEIVLSDVDFADWPLGEQQVVDALQAWASPGRSLRLIAQRFDVFERSHGRFVRWRQLWDHIVQAHACMGMQGKDLPSAVLAPRWFLHRIDTDSSRGVCGVAPGQRAALKHLLDECFQQGRPAFPASVLGL